MSRAPRSVSICVHWTHPTSELDYDVDVTVTPGVPKPSGLYPGCSSLWVPGDGDATAEITGVWRGTEPAWADVEGHEAAIQEAAIEAASLEF